LPVDFVFVCGTWSLASREQHRVYILDSRVPRIILGSESEGIRGGWIKLLMVLMQKSGDEMKEDSMARTYGLCGVAEKCIQRYNEEI
jgi:hypothetical protein